MMQTYEQWQLDQYQSALEALRPELARLGIPAEEEAPDKPGLRRRRATVTMVRDLIARQEASGSLRCRRYRTA